MNIRRRKLLDLPHLAYIGVGSNLAQPIEQVCWAINAMNQLNDCQISKASTLYANPPIGPSQPDFINAVVALKTALGADELLRQLQNLEQQRQRTRTIHWGPRTLDLDILLFDHLILNKEELIIPHPYLEKRPFVILPLHEIANTLILPNKLAVAYLADQWQNASMYPVACCIIDN